MIVENGEYCTIKGIVVWDGITNPETKTEIGKSKWSCKIVINPQLQAQELQDVDQLAKACLLTSEFQGQLPQGALWPVSPVNAADKFNVNGQFNGFVCMNAGTYQGQPQVHDSNGQIIPPMQLTSALYAGCEVDLLVNFYAYNNRSRGIAAGLAGLQITNNTLPRLQIGGGIDSGSVFGRPVAQSAAQQQPAQQTAGFMPGQQQQVQQGGYVAPQQQQVQQQVDPNANNAQVMQNQHVAQSAAQQQNVQGVQSVGGPGGNFQQAPQYNNV